MRKIQLTAKHVNEFLKKGIILQIFQLILYNMIHFFLFFLRIIMTLVFKDDHYVENFEEIGLGGVVAY